MQRGIPRISKFWLRSEVTGGGGQGIVQITRTSYCYWATIKDAATLAFEVLRDIILERLGTQFIRLQAWVAVAVDTNDRL